MTRLVSGSVVISDDYFKNVMSGLYSLFGGLIADRLPRRRTLIVTQGLELALAMVSVLPEATVKVPELV